MERIDASNELFTRLRDLDGESRTNAIARWTLRIARSLGYNDHEMFDYFATNKADKVIESSWAKDRIYVEGPRVRAAILRLMAS